MIKYIQIFVLIPAYFLSAGLFAQDQSKYQEWAQRQNIPREVQAILNKSGFDSLYTVSFHVNPFYLRGDFNGDGVMDHALLIKRQTDGKIGVAIVQATIPVVEIVGAGFACGNGGTDFKWLDAWEVFPMGPVPLGASQEDPPTLKGDALHVYKLESASGLIYWTGENYSWYQQGD